MKAFLLTTALLFPVLAFADESMATAIAPGVIERLQSEPDAADPESDAYMTGFAISVLRGAGTPADDVRIQRGIAWLRSTQRVSGRWWMQSLQTQGPDGWKFSTYFATVQAMRALGACGELNTNNEDKPWQ
jgi:hypothetical protein